MNRSELIQLLSRSTGMSADGARTAIEALFGNGGEPGLIAAVLQRGERVQLTGFGTFEARQRKERPGRNPHTHERILIPAGPAPTFRAGSGLRALLRASQPPPAAP